MGVCGLFVCILKEFSAIVKIDYMVDYYINFLKKSLDKLSRNDEILVVDVFVSFTGRFPLWLQHRMK